MEVLGQVARADLAQGHLAQGPPLGWALGQVGPSTNMVQGSTETHQSGARSMPPQQQQLQ